MISMRNQPWFPPIRLFARPSTADLQAFCEAAQDAQLNAAAADALVELLSGHNSQLALGSEAAAAATRLVSERLQQLATTLRVSEALKAGEEVEERVYHACRVFCAFCRKL